MSGALHEQMVEEAALAWLAEAGWATRYGPDLAPNGPRPERVSFEDPFLPGRLDAALARLNPGVEPAAIAEAKRKLLQDGQGSLLAVNRTVSDYLVRGIEVTVMVDGEPRGRRIQVIDFENVANNDVVAVNQFTVTEGAKERRPDIVCFVNGLPLVIIELKDAGNAQADVWAAWNQLQTYQKDLTRLCRTNVLLVASDGLHARMGALGTPRERFAAWKTIDGDELAGPDAVQLEVLIRGALDPARFLDLARSFVLFEEDPHSEQLVKKVAQYHQYHAVRKAVESALAASRREDADHGKGGVLWHTQGSGKSLTMLFFAGKLVQADEMANPTIVMLTDRNDLDDQLFGQFSRGAHLLGQAPVQAASRAQLQALLRTNSGGVIFTTLQKFTPDTLTERQPLLSARSNIVVMADEAHRGQYDLLDGFAASMRQALPNATFVGFTGTPLELDDKDTRLVFGDYIDVYDIARAVADGATVPIHYESRLIQLDLPAGQTADLDAAFDEITEGNEAARSERAKARWTDLEKVVGSAKRLDQVAADLVAHLERRQAVQPGKGIVVCMSREICVRLYDAIAKLRPEWATDDDHTGQMKVVITGSAADEPALQPHLRTKQGRQVIERRFKDPGDPLQLVLVRDMWLTGFDVPPLHTMYLDKPMRGHGLMQAIARVNRVYGDKPGGLIVDYLGLANNLRAALRTYTASGGQGQGVAGTDPALPGEAALVAVLREKLEICRALLHGVDYQAFLTGSPQERLRVLPKVRSFIRLKDDDEPGFIKRLEEQTKALLQAYKLAGATPEAQRVKYEVAFFELLRNTFGKRGGIGRHRETDALDFAVRQLIDEAIAPGGVVDIFAAAGLAKPEISILSEGFLADVRNLPHKNLAVELLERLLRDEIRSRTTTNVVEERRFSERLRQSLLKYQNRSVETAQVIEELIALGRDLRAAVSRGEQLGLSEDELAFYDALGGADVAQVLGDQQLLLIAREVAATVRANATIDWTVQESVRANMRRMVRRVLRQHGYPPDRTADATATVVEQAERLTAELAA